MGQRKKDKKFEVRRLRGREHFGEGALALSVRWQDVTRGVLPHDHDFHEIALITRGRGEHITSRRRVLTTAGDVWIIRPGHWHTYLNVRHLGVYNCLLGPALFRRIAPELQRDPGALELFWRGPARQARDGCCLLRLNAAQRLEAESDLERLGRALDGPAPVSELAAHGHLLIFLGHLARALPKSGRQDTASKSRARTPAAAHAVDFLEAHYAEPIRMASLARETGLSVPHLARLFRRMTGLSPMRYLASVRVQRACLLLAEGTRPITEIAGAVGWPDPNLFARRFKALMGIPPRQYRQRQQRQVKRDGEAG